MIAIRTRPSRAFPRRIGRGGPATVGGAAHPGALDPCVVASAASPARHAGAMPGLAGLLNEWAQRHEPAVDAAASIAGGGGRTPQPEAMMARGARVTGSGAGAPAAGPLPAWPQSGAVVLASGSRVVFCGLDELAVEVFL